MRTKDACPSIAAMGSQTASIAAAHMERAFRYILRGPNVTAEPGFVRLITGEPHPFGNFAVFSETAAPAEMQAAMGPLVECGAPAALLLTAPASDATAKLLADSGFVSDHPMPAMAVETDVLGATSLPPGYTFSRVGEGAESDEWAGQFSVGFEIPHAVGEAFSPNAVHATTAADAPIQYFAIRKGGKMVCTSLVYLADGVAGIYCVATIPEERGRGLAAHVTAEPLRLLRRLGYNVGVLQSTAAGHSVYRRLGFKEFGELGFYVRLPG